VECVNPHVSFGMPFRILRTVNERVEFREKPYPLAIPKKGESPRRTNSKEDQLLPLIKDPFGS
jgi:hypothetical protein